MSAAVSTVGPARLDGGELVPAHRERRLRVLDRERPAEPAALVGARDVHEVEALDGPEQAPRTIPDLEHPERVAGLVERDRVREGGADVGHAELVDEELGELEHPRGDAGDVRRERLVAGVLGHGRVVVADHRGARRATESRRRRRARTTLGERADQRHARVAVAGVEVHLAAARLRLGEDDLVAQVLKDRTVARPTSGASASLKQAMNSATPHGLAVHWPRVSWRLVADEGSGCRPDQRPELPRSPETSPSERACTRMLPSAVASTGPAMTGSRQAFAVSWHRSAFRDPPPTTWTTSIVRPDSRAASSTARA